MKKFLPLIAVTVAVMLLFGCGGDDKDSGGSDNGSSSSAKPSKAATPEDAFKDFKAVVLSKNYGAAWDMLSADTQKGFSDMLEMIKGQYSAITDEQKAQAETVLKEKSGLTIDEYLKLTVQDFFKMMFDQMPAEDLEELRGSTIKECKIDGDKATAVFVKADGTEDKDNDTEFVKENGAWKISFKNQ